MSNTTATTSLRNQFAGTNNKSWRVTSDEFQALFMERDDIYDDRIAEETKYNSDYPAILAIKYSARRMIPYGRWHCEDGRIVTFNREYQPMYQRLNGVDTFLLHSDYIRDIVQVEYFYNDHNSPVNYLLRKFKENKLSAQYSRESKKSLLICLRIIRDYEPKNSRNNGTSWNELTVLLR